MAYHFTPAGAVFAPPDAWSVVDDWFIANTVEAQSRLQPDGAQSGSVMLSMPPDSPADRVESAARTRAKDTFGARHNWLMVRHDDTDRPCPCRH